MITRNKADQIKVVLDYLTHRMSVMSDADTKRVREILEGGEITLSDVVEWYIDYVLRSV